MGTSAAPSARPSQANFQNHYGEGDEGHEEEGRQQDWQGPICQGHGLPRDQGEDLHWLEEVRPGQEHNGQDREQEKERPREEVAMDRGCQESARRPQDQGLLRSRRAPRSTLRQRSSTTSETFAQSVRCTESRGAPAPGVGISTPVERVSFQLLMLTSTGDE